MVWKLSEVKSWFIFLRNIPQDLHALNVWLLIDLDWNLKNKANIVYGKERFWRIVLAALLVESCRPKNTKYAPRRGSGRRRAEEHRRGANILNGKFEKPLISPLIIQHVLDTRVRTCRVIFTWRDYGRLIN